jgi:dTDP-4-dehydrorhamnose reductase
MKLLVIGANGQIARCLGAIEDDGITVVRRGRPEVDVRISSTLERAIGETRPDVVVNAAAYTAVDRAEQEPELARAINGRGAGVLACICEAAKLPLIHLSTDYVFDGTSPTPYAEMAPIAPLNAYGRTKADGERRVMEACERYLIVRTSWVHSARGRNFVTGMLRLARQRPEICVVDDQRGSPTYAPHLARALVSMAKRVVEWGPHCEGWGIYHAAGSGDTTWCGLASEAFAVAEWLGVTTAKIKPITTPEYPTPARRPANSRLDCNKLARVFGLALPDWRTGVALSVGEAIGEERKARAA